MQTAAHPSGYCHRRREAERAAQDIAQSCGPPAKKGPAARLTRRLGHWPATLFCLLSGARPGEAARMTVNDVDLEKRMFKITNAKAGKDINLPISPQIAHAIAMAASVDYKGHPEVQQTGLLFPGCMQVSARAELPIRGQNCGTAIARSAPISALVP
ncbi:MAG: tyrosine-type recombinase/integrase [Bradyrhizobium sp.]